METKQPIETGKLFNPTDEDLEFLYDSAKYVVPAGEEKILPTKAIAIHGAKKLADKNVKTTNPDEKRVLIASYLENSDPEVVAKNLGVNLEKIRKQALEKEKEKARVVNLEAQVAEQRKQIEKLMEMVKATVEKPEEKPVEEKPVEEEPKESEETKSELSYAELQKLAKDKGLKYVGVKKEDLIKELNK